MRKACFIGAILLVWFGCQKDEAKNEGSAYTATIECTIGDCATLFEKSYICFDSVISDSRCPNGATCFWEGNAEIKINIKNDGVKHEMKLNTNSKFRTDTTIDNLSISLIALNPYPDLTTNLPTSKYKATLSIIDLHKTKSNAKILSFTADKCLCCWGWAICIGNDTIQSDDAIIGEKVGFEITDPVAVYIELGELEPTCTEMGGKKYYKIKQLIKTK